MALSRKRKIIIGASTAAVLVLIIVVSIFASRKEELEVTTAKVETRPELRSNVTASGEVRPIQFINLTSEVAGRIEELYVNPGDLVKKGQPLVRLDPTQLQSQQEAQFAGVQAAISDVQNARSQVTAAENNVAQAQQSLLAAQASLSSARQQVVVSQTSVDRSQVDLETAQRELKRSSDLVESGVQSRADYDAARDRLAQAQVALRTSKEQLQQQKIAVEEAKVRINQQEITVQDSRTGVERARESVKASEERANQQQALLRGQASQRAKATQYSPLTGVIADIPSRVGQYAIANFQSTPLLTIADMSTINVEVNVDETEIASIDVGQPAKIKVDALGDKEITGTVAQKNPLAINKSDTTSGGISNRVNVQEAKEFKVIVKLENLPDDLRDSLRPGMSATATITTKVKKDVLAVPLQAIIEKAPEASTPTAAATATPKPAVGEKPKDIKGVYVLEGNKAKFVEVTTGITGESDTEVTSGLRSGAEVVTGPSRALRSLKDGASVKRQTRKPNANANTNEAK